MSIVIGGIELFQVDGEWEKVKSEIRRFIPSFTFCFVDSVYDGDTITVIGKVEDKEYKFSVRLTRYDSPEMKSKSEKEREYALRSKKALQQKIEKKAVFIDIKKYDKYGRLLAEITTFEGVNISDWMLQNKYGVPYKGEKKKEFSSLDWI
jgi:endonuclease YncB( thermonuclease family)